MEEKEKGCLENVSMEHIEALHSALAEVIDDIKGKLPLRERLEDYYYHKMLVIEEKTLSIIRNHELGINNK